MAKGDINAQSIVFFKSLFRFLYLLYKIYQPYIKSVLLVIIAYIAYRCGRLTIVHSLDRNVSQLSNIVRNRALYTIYIPQKLKKVIKIKKIILIIITISVIFYFASYTKPKFFRKLKIKYVYIYAGTLLMTFISLWGYQIYLNMQLKQGRSVDLTIKERLYGLQKQLGPRAEGLLKIFLCKDTIGRHKSPPRNICTKNNCKNYRQALKQKKDRIEYLVNNALNFPWCIICKRRLPFNQFIDFQAAFYERQDNNSQEQEIERRKQFLLEQIIRMINWMKQLSPCNCSKIYWRQSVKYIRDFKKYEKEIDQQLLIYEHRLGYR